MLETFKYINHLNEVIEFGKNGIYVDYNTLRDYSWDITSANNKIASFKKGIVSKTIPIIIKCNSEVEGIEIKNRLFEVFEKDVLAKKNGKIIIGDYYLKCYITGTKKTKYLIDKGYLHLSLTMKTDYPAWIKETYSIFRPKSALNTSESAEGREILIGNATNSILTNYAVYGRSEQKSYTGKNLISRWTMGSQTLNGIDFVVNEDGSVTANGTATADAWFSTWLSYENGEYIGSGCPSGGSNSTYYMNFRNDKYSPNAKDYGSGVSFELTDSNNTGTLGAIIGIKSGTVCNNLVFKPMIRKASITDATYEKYVGGEPSPNPSYPQAIESVADKGKNQIENSAISQTINGVKFVVHSDGSVTVSGTATADTKLPISEQILPVGDYIASGGYDANCDLCCEYASGALVILQGEGNPFDVQVTDATTILTFYVYVPKGATVTNKTVYPMVRKADIADDTYEPPYNFLWVNTNNKNLLNPDTIEVGFISADTGLDNDVNAENGRRTPFIKVKPNTQYMTNTTSSIRLFFYTEKKEFISSTVISSGGFKTLSNYGYVRIHIDINTNPSFTTSFMLCEGTDATYVPYQSTKATIILNDSHRGIKVSEGGNFTDETGQQWVCDTLEKYADGSGKLVQRVCSTVLNGSEDWYEFTNTGGLFYQYHTNLSNSKSASNVLCSHFASIAIVDRKTITGIIEYNDKAFRFALQLSYGIDTIDKWKAWLVGNNVNVFYELAEYIETPLTAEQIAEIEKLQTFEGVTHITNNDNAYQEVTYSIKQYLDFPYGYEYDFTADFDSDELLNSSFVPVDFRMVIHGAVANPSVFIAGHEYSVDVTVEQGDYLTIDSQAKTIVLSKKDGTQVNCFNYRNRDSYVFEKIPSGKNEITSTNDLNIDITLLDERSEPRWT